MSSDTDDFLAHYGIKGMKWGVRRKPGPDGTVGGSGSSRSEKRAAKKDAKVQKQVRRYKKQSDSYTMKRGTREELQQERKKIQSKIDKMDTDKVFQSLGKLGSSSNTRNKRRTDSSGKTSFQNLSAREKHNVNQVTRKRLEAIYVGKNVAGAILATTAYTAGAEGVMRLSNMPPKTRDQGRKAMAAFVGLSTARTAYSNISGVRLESKFEKLSARRHEIDRQLSGKW